MTATETLLQKAVRLWACPVCHRPVHAVIDRSRTAVIDGVEMLKLPCGHVVAWWSLHESEKPAAPMPMSTWVDDALGFLDDMSNGRYEDDFFEAEKTARKLRRAYFNMSAPRIPSAGLSPTTIRCDSEQPDAVQSAGADPHDARRP